MRKKGKVVIIIIAAVIVLGIIIGIVASAISGGSSKAPTVSNSVISKGTVTNMIDASGYIESANTENVYSTLAYPIQEIKVELGDEVKAGDVICVLDSKKLKEQIEVTEKTLNLSNSSNYNALKAAEDNYLNLKNSIDSGIETNTNTADTALLNAKNNLDNCQREYDRMVSELNSDQAIELESLKSQVNSYYDSIQSSTAIYHAGVSDLEQSKRDKIASAEKMIEVIRKEKRENPSESANQRYNSYYQELANLLPTSLLSVRQQLETAQNSYDSAIMKLNDSEKKYNTGIDDMEIKLEAAKKSYSDAKAAVEATKLNTSTQLETLKAQYELALQKVSDDPSVLELANMKEDLLDCEIKATTNGTVTAINCEEGGIPQGTLIKIQDTTSFKVTVNIKEYDISSIKKDMPAKITCGSLGDKEFDGIVTSVAPAGVANQQTGAIYFPVEVEITSDSTGLLIGANAKVDIICDEVQDAFSVPFGTVKVNEDGQDVIFIAEKVADGYKAKEIPVTVGLETDFDMQVISDEITEETIVITEPDSVTDGEKIVLKKKFTKAEEEK